MAKLKRRDVHVIFTEWLELWEHAKGIGEFLPLPVDVADLVGAVHRALFALRFDGRKAWHKGDELMARITAEHLIKHLDLAGFVVMKKPPLKAHSTG